MGGERSTNNSQKRKNRSKHRADLIPLLDGRGEQKKIEINQSVKKDKVFKIKRTKG